MQKILAYSLLAAILSGCASAPTGPRVAVMPAPGKPFELFAEEDRYCRSYAERSGGQSRDDAAAKNFAGAVVAGTAIGAAAGALGNEGRGGGEGVGVRAVGLADLLDVLLLAQDGEEGLQRAGLVQPGLILLDVMLPGIDGWEILKRLRKSLVCHVAANMGLFSYPCIQGSDSDHP